MMINLWNWKDLPEMNLAPCCFLSMWDVTDGELNCMLIQRSGDVGLGVPFNTTQYAVLTHLIAQSTGLKVGKLTHVINNAHIYENHFEAMKEQLNRYNQLDTEGRIKNQFSLLNNTNEISNIFSSNPMLKLNPNIKDFYEFTIDDILLENYNHMGKLEMEVSV
jgi:thymidylate synthase